VRSTASQDSPPSDTASHPIILYDGVCGLCNRLNQFVLRRDPDAIFRFASLQSPFAARILSCHGGDPQDLDTVYVVVNHDLSKDDLTKREISKDDQRNESLLARSDAIIFVLERLGGIWKVLGFLLQGFPKPLRDAAYRLVARNRYRIFGRFETCMLPSPESRNRFLDV
jgi:predicted DCC family thiol-disulfide oxidoreductase YuxK